MNKKILKVFTIMIAIMCAFVGCSKASNSKKTSNNVLNDDNFNKTGLPIVNEKISLTAVAARRDDVSEFDGMAFFDMIEDKTNIHIDWECIPEESFQEKKNLMFASNQLPDIFYCCLDWSDISKYYSSDYFVPLNDYIDNYSEYYKKYINIDKKILATTTCEDNNIYTLANFKYFPNDNTYPALYVNKSWLNKLGLDMPKTIDDYYEMLKAFKNAGDINENGNNDEIPLSFRFGDGIQGLGALFGSFGYVHNYGFIIDENSDLIYVPMTDEYKEALKYFNKLYTEGLMDPEGFTQNNSIYTSKIRSTPSSVGSAVFWNLNWAFGEKENYDFELMEPLIGHNGEQKWIVGKKGPYMLHSPSIGISTDCKHPEIAFRWADYLYELDNLIQSYNGMYGVCIEKKEDGSIKQIKSKEALETTPQLYAQTMAPGVSGLAVTTKEMLDVLEQIPEKYEKEELNKFYHKYSVQYAIPTMLFSKEENETKFEIGADIDTYVKEMATKFMTEGNIEEKWDEYLSNLEKMNIKKYIELISNKYDDFKERVE